MLRRFALAAVLTSLATPGVALAQTPQPTPETVYRVGGAIKAPRKVLTVAPVYPAIARANGTEGVVILELTLDATGAVESARVIRSISLLDEAALTAARQWKYEPTLVNGVPAKIRYNVTVNFSLAAQDNAVSPDQSADASQAAPPATTSPADPANTPATPASADTGRPATDAILNEPAPVRVGGVIRAPMKLADVPPVYPAIAQQAQVEGVVILELLVAPSGAVRDAKVIRSVPLLDEAALDAVRQWIYTPTLLNGVAVPIFYNVTVSFSLRR